MEPDTEICPTESPPEPRAGNTFWRHLLVTAVAVGILAGLAEVCFTYNLPAAKQDWRAVLPPSPTGLMLFVLTAAVTDVLLVVIGSVLVGGLLRGLHRIAFGPVSSSPGRLLTRTLILAGTTGYLYVGWMGLFLLLRTDDMEGAYVATMLAGVAGALVVSLIVASLLALAERRLHPACAVGAWMLAMVVGVAATLPAFGSYRASQSEGVDIPLAGDGPRPNILLVTLDTLRADYVGCMGNNWVETPGLDALAADGILFEDTISQSPTTGPSHCSIMTGVYPPDHQAWNGMPMRQGLLTIADVLSANGYETIAFTASTTTRSINTGLQQGFDRYVDSLVSWSSVFGRDEFQNLIFFYLIGVAQNFEIRGDVVTRRALAWLDQRSDRPFFVWLHYFDPHDPYEAPEPYRLMYRDKVKDGLPMARIREDYAGEITYTDAQLQRVIDALRKRGLYDKTVIVVTSDHGEAFGEEHWQYTEVGHGSFIYDTTQHVPLIIKHLDSRGKGRRISQQVQLVDIFPTILRWVEIDIPPTLCGVPLNELLHGEGGTHPRRPAFSFNIVDAVDPDAPESATTFVDQVGMRTAEWKYIDVPHYGQPELYRLQQDPAERMNMARAHPAMCQERHDTLTKMLDRDRDIHADPRARMTPALLRQLQALGYLGGSEDEEPQPDSE